MADNIQVTQGTGTVMATDDIGSVQYPRVKVSWGVDGAAVDASATNPFPVVATQSGTWNITNVTGTVSLPTGAATSAAQTTGNTSLASIDTKFPAQSLPGLLPVDTLAALGVSRLVAMGAASANIALTTTTRRVSIHATVAGFYAVGTGAQTASSTSHYIGAGERLDFDVAANTQIAAIRSATDGTLYISELIAA